MITNVYSHSGFVTANSTVSGPYINAGTPSAGMLRYHNQQVQVYDGTSWLAMGSTASVGLSTEAEEIIAWAREKMQEEREARAMALDYPAVADALGAVREAQEQLRTVVALCRV
jgi:hypothetical protein